MELEREEGCWREVLKGRQTEGVQRMASRIPTYVEFEFWRESPSHKFLAGKYCTRDRPSTYSIQTTHPPCIYLVYDRSFWQATSVEEFKSISIVQPVLQWFLP